MEIVIDIPKTQYEYLTKIAIAGKEPLGYFERVIMRGIPLPEHHGRLIDADALQTEMDKDVRKAMSFVDLKDFVWLAPTIIETDR